MKRQAMRRLALIVLVLLPSCAIPAPPPAPAADVIAIVKDAVAKKDLDTARRAIDAERAARGLTPALLDAMSQLAAAKYAARDLEGAQSDARVAYDAARA